MIKKALCQKKVVSLHSVIMLYCDRNCCVKDKKSKSYKIINPNKKMKKIKEPQVKVVKFEKVDIIATSGLVSDNTASVNVNHHEYGTEGVTSWF